MITLQQLSLSRGNKILLNKVNLSLHEKQKIGLTGQNGCGKSSLFALLAGQLTPDHGGYQIKKSLRISQLTQDIPDSDRPAIDFVLSGDEEYIKLQEKLKKAEAEEDGEALLACHDEMMLTEGYSKPAQAAAIMSGLGFNSQSQHQAVNQFSGGWRMRLSLARCLIKPADLFLLDEPTNHLDMEAIFWLERWLKQCSVSVILISHDREFLDAFVTHILHIEQQNISLYPGNYSQFEKIRAEKLALQQATYEKQQDKINHLMAFVNRFKAKASKAKQAQSRLKSIAKMELVAQAQKDSPFSFEFYPCPQAGKPLISCDGVAAGYQQNQPVLKHINLNLNPGDRIAFLGPNGEGKSTLIKTLTGDLPPLSGELFQHKHISVGYYAQHQLEQLDINLSPIETILALSPQAREQSIRDFLGGFNFCGDMASQSIRPFSGGEKARLALAKLVWQKPNILFLDEPTNHLDLNMRSAIELALQTYEGALVLISHDRHLLRTTVNDFYLIYQQQVQPFKGVIDDYLEWVQTKKQIDGKTTETSTSDINYRQKKSKQNRLKKLEESMSHYQHQLKQLDIKLADNTLYNEENKSKLEQMLQEQQILNSKLHKTEEEWMNLSEELEYNP